MNKKEIKKKILLPILLVLAGFAVMQIMVFSRKVPEKQIDTNPGPLVEVLAVRESDHRMDVFATGIVQARQEASVTPQVSGRVIEVAHDFIAGGYFRKGDILFRIEAIDYKLAEQNRLAQVARAEYDLATVESRARIARMEWERISEDSVSEEPNPLVLYEPQLKNAKAGLAAAGAALKQARLNLERTTLRAPFNCIVRSERIDYGEFLRAGVGVAELTGTNTAEIVVPLPLHELRWLSIPSPEGNRQGSRATVQITVDGLTYSREGRLVRSMGDVDPQGRMARLVVSIDDPYGLSMPQDKTRFDMAMGMFVEVILHGETVPSVFVIPAAALRENSAVWLAGEDDRVRIRPVEVIRRERESFLVRDGLETGDRVILTNLTGVADGMKVRPVAEGGGQ